METTKKGLIGFFEKFIQNYEKEVIQDHGSQLWSKLLLKNKQVQQIILEAITKLEPLCGNVIGQHRTQAKRKILMQNLYSQKKKLNPDVDYSSQLENLIPARIQRFFDRQNATYKELGQRISNIGNEILEYQTQRELSVNDEELPQADYNMTANKKLVEILTTVGGSDVAFFQDLRDISVTFKQHDMWKEQLSVEQQVREGVRIIEQRFNNLDSKYYYKNEYIKEKSQFYIQQIEEQFYMESQKLSKLLERNQMKLNDLEIKELYRFEEDQKVIANIGGIQEYTDIGQANKRIRELVSATQVINRRMQSTNGEFRSQVKKYEKLKQSFKTVCKEKADLQTKIDQFIDIQDSLLQMNHISFENREQIRELIQKEDLNAIFDKIEQGEITQSDAFDKINKVLQGVDGQLQEMAKETKDRVLKSKILRIQKQLQMGGLDDIIKEAESTPSPRHKRRFNTTRTTIARKQQQYKKSDGQMKLKPVREERRMSKSKTVKRRRKNQSSDSYISEYTESESYVTENTIDKEFSEEIINPTLIQEDEPTQRIEEKLETKIELMYSQVEKFHMLNQEEQLIQLNELFQSKENFEKVGYSILFESLKVDGQQYSINSIIQNSLADLKIAKCNNFTQTEPEKTSNSESPSPYSIKPLIKGILLKNMKEYKNQAFMQDLSIPTPKAFNFQSNQKVKKDSLILQAFHNWYRKANLKAAISIEEYKAEFIVQARKQGIKKLDKDTSTRIWKIVIDRRVSQGETDLFSLYLRSYYNTKDWKQSLQVFIDLIEQGSRRNIFHQIYGIKGDILVNFQNSKLSQQVQEKWKRIIFKKLSNSARILGKQLKNEHNISEVFYQIVNNIKYIKHRVYTINKLKQDSISQHQENLGWTLNIKNDFKQRWSSQNRFRQVERGSLLSRQKSSPRRRNFTEVLSLTTQPKHQKSFTSRRQLPEINFA